MTYDAVIAVNGRRRGKDMSNRRKLATLTTEGFTVSAWKDATGLMRLEVRSDTGKRTVLGLDHSWEGDAHGGLARMMFTADPAIVEYVTTERPRTDDRRESPRRLRRLGRSTAFRTWFRNRRGQKATPARLASAIERARRREHRRLEDGRSLARMSIPRYS